MRKLQSISTSPEIICGLKDIKTPSHLTASSLVQLIKKLYTVLIGLFTDTAAILNILDLRSIIA